MVKLTIDSLQDAMMKLVFSCKYYTLTKSVSNKRAQAFTCQIQYTFLFALRLEFHSFLICTQNCSETIHEDGYERREIAHIVCSWNPLPTCIQPMRIPSGHSATPSVVCYRNSISLKTDHLNKQLKFFSFQPIINQLKVPARMAF